MANDVINTNDVMLSSLLDYFKYIYEEEKDRTKSINDAVKVYILLISFILGAGLYKVLPLNNSFPMNIDYNDVSIALIINILFLLAVLSFLTSLIFTVLIMKVWKFERLCEPKNKFAQAIILNDYNEYLISVIADYIVTSNRNNYINSQKAILLSRALVFLISGLTLFIIGLILIFISLSFGG